MDPFFLSQEDDQVPILNFILSPPEPLLDSISLLSDSFTTLDQAQTDETQMAPVSQSAFKTYDKSTSETQQSTTSVTSNVHKRLFGVLGAMKGKMREDQQALREKSREQSCGNIESTRGFRHMMRERMRRERMSQSYADLHSLLGSSSLKGDKHTIVKNATRYLEELKNKKERLHKRNEELKAEYKRKMVVISCAIIELRISVSVLPLIDSLKLILRCFRLVNLKIASFRSEISDGGDLLVTVGVLNQNFAKDEIQKIVRDTLAESEKEIYKLFPLQEKWFISCHVENGENT